MNLLFFVGLSTAETAPKSESRTNCQYVVLIWENLGGAKGAVPADCCSNPTDTGVTCDANKNVIAINWRGKGLKTFGPGFANLKKLEEL